MWANRTISNLHVKIKTSRYVYIYTKISHFCSYEQVAGTPEMVSNIHEK